MSQKRITLLGATGSIGSSTIEVIEADPERFSVVAVVAHTRADKLAAIARQVGARLAVVANETAWPALRDALSGSGIAGAAGQEALEAAAAEPVDICVSAIVGAAGVRATSAAVRAGSNVALANKECLTCAGAPFMQLVEQRNIRVLPVDSEHNALYQLLEGRERSSVRAYTLTASGGPFRSWTHEQLRRATPEMALRHPTWTMGAKVTIDSATLMNKGLELIEAKHLFGMEPDTLDVLIHPQSVVHALITFTDGSLQAELGATDMRRPIAHCLYRPERRTPPLVEIDLCTIGQLTFERPDHGRFPALRLAREALARGQGAPTVLNAANEVAVEAFLDRRIAFVDIPAIVEETLLAAEAEALLGEPETISAALELDAESRVIARRNLRLRAVVAS